jgi:hypothetical protein
MRTARGDCPETPSTLWWQPNRSRIMRWARSIRATFEIVTAGGKVALLVHPLRWSRVGVGRGARYAVLALGPITAYWRAFR